MLMWEKVTNTKVSFESSIDLSLVTFKIGESYITEKINIKAVENTNTSEKGTEKGTEKLSKNQQLILDNMIKNPNITIEELVQIVGIVASKIKENISKLKAKGIIERTGAAKGGYWKILKESEILISYKTGLK